MIITGWVDGMGWLLEGSKSSLFENKEAKKLHPLGGGDPNE
jgi:hypothetical protein